MKTTSRLLSLWSICLIVVLSAIDHSSYAQTDSTSIIQTEAQVSIPDTISQEPVSEKEKTKGDNKLNKHKDEFIPYVGASLNHLNVSSVDYESDMGLGYHFGFNYRRGRFFYWQLGARFNHAKYNLIDHLQSDTSSFSVSCIDVPITGGINVLSAVNRVLALRIFVSAVPSFVLNVGDNDFDFTKDHINTFILYGQAGVGFNVAFLVIEAGYNYGFQDLLINTESKPGQLFVNLGFRF